MVKIVARRAAMLGWFELNTDEASCDNGSFAGVAIKDAQGQYVSMPYDIAPSLMTAIEKLDEPAVMSMISEASGEVIAGITARQKYVLVESTGARIPIIKSLKKVTIGLTHTSSTCIVLDEKLILLWASGPDQLLSNASEVEKQLLELVSHNTLKSKFPVADDTNAHAWHRMEKPWIPLTIGLGTRPHQHRVSYGEALMRKMKYT
jgi:hypothetical protein